MTAMFAVVAMLIVVAGGASALAWWCGYGRGYRAAMAYRKIAAQVEAGTVPVDDAIDHDAA